MKKILILLLILMPIVYGQDISNSLSKNDYYQYETLQSEVFINLTLAEKITASNFGLADKNNGTISVPVFFEELSLNHYFVYFNLPKLEKDVYYFNIKNVKYFENNVLKITSKYYEFNLENVSSVSIYPGILNKVNSTILTITNHNNPINITVKADEISLNQNILLNDKASIDLEIPKNTDNFDIRVDYGNRFYLIPVIPYKENITKEIEQLMPNENAVVLLNSTFGNKFQDKITIKKDISLKGPFYIRNTLDTPVNGIVFDLTGNLKEIARINLTYISELKPNEIITQYIWINENQAPSKSSYSGKIEMKYGDNILTIPLEIIFTDFVDNILRDNKTINQSFIENVEEEKTGNTGLVVLFLSLILIVLIGLIYFILKKKNKNFCWKAIFRRS